MPGKTVRSDLEHCLGGPPAVFRIWASKQFQKITTYASMHCARVQFELEYNSLQESVIWGIPVKDFCQFRGVTVRVGGK